jgi:hypothetical protein
LGTIGLILIVLEGSLELQFNKKKAPLIIKSFIAALLPLVALAFLLSFLFHYFGEVPFKVALINSIPFLIISSAIAIPSVKSLSRFNREFVIYESCISEGFYFSTLLYLTKALGFIHLDNLF